MGVTVHFEGRLKSPEAFSSLLLHIEEIGRSEALLTERFENFHAKLGRGSEEQPWDYVGPTKGIMLYLHEDCEPLRLEFDRELYISEWVKTQFAGVDTHIRLIQILRDVERFFQTLVVNDEGEYWESGNQSVLEGYMRTCNKAIAEIAAQNPHAQVKVRESNGRITDLIG